MSVAHHNRSEPVDLVVRRFGTLCAGAGALLRAAPALRRRHRRHRRRQPQGRSARHDPRREHPCVPAACSNCPPRCAPAATVRSSCGRARPSISVGPDTLLEFPALEKRGGPIDRIVQPRGNAFYNIGKRDGRKLRIETPFLVGVVKGTQFNVAAQDDATTISLFEGLLEVRAADDSDVVDLQAGEIASRDRDGQRHSRPQDGGGKTPPVPKRSAGTGSGGGAPPPSAPAPPVVEAVHPTPASTPAPRSDSGDSLYAGRGPGQFERAVSAQRHRSRSQASTCGRERRFRSAVERNATHASVDLGLSVECRQRQRKRRNVDLGVSGNPVKGDSVNVDLGDSVDVGDR